MDELVLFEGDNMTHSDRLSISIWVSPAVESSRDWTSATWCDNDCIKANLYPVHIEGFICVRLRFNA